MDPQPPVEDRTDTNKEKCYFAYSARLRVVGSELDFSAISAALNLQPTYIHRKGERGHSPTPWEHDMWSYDPPLDKSEPLHKHIDALWESIEPHKEYLLGLLNSKSKQRWMCFSDTAPIVKPPESRFHTPRYKSSLSWRFRSGYQ